MASQPPSGVSPKWGIDQSRVHVLAQRLTCSSVWTWEGAELVLPPCCPIHWLDDLVGVTSPLSGSIPLSV